MPVFATEGHTYIAFKSFEAVYGSLGVVYGRRDRRDSRYTLYRNGIHWPDVPTDDPNSGRTLDVPSFLWGFSGGKDAVEKYFFGSDKSALVYRSHFADLQYWHSMAPSTTMTNAQVLEKIIAQAREWYSNALSQNNIFHIGKLNHMVTSCIARWKR
jgi:hypothetical protein